MDGDANSGAARPDEWGPAVASGDATKLAELVLVSSGSKPERALSVLRHCVSLLEEEVEFSAPAGVPSPPTTPGPGRGSFFNALIVALNETWNGGSWYTSTKELQLASLEFCIACRNYKTLHLKINAQIPRRLLAAADAPSPHPKRLCRTRVPRLRARRVTWNMRTAAELRNPIFALKDAQCLELGEDFEDGLEAVAWPRSLRTIGFHFSSQFNQPIELVQWPASLQRLEFGPAFNQPIECVKFPASLQELIISGFSGCSDFNQPIAAVNLPNSLQHVYFGAEFNHPIEEVAWPSSLTELIFDINSSFDCPVEGVAWPPSLQELVFGQSFNRPIERAKLPASLKKLTFVGRFNQPIEGVLFPDSLRRLFFGDDFNQPVDNVRWPASLREISFGWCDDSEDSWMMMWSDFNQPISSSVWPASLRRLTLGETFSQSLQGLGTWMPNLRALRLLDHNDGSGTHDSLLRGIEWPKGLRQLTVFEQSSLDGVVIPSSVQVYRPKLVH